MSVPPRPDRKPSERSIGTVPFTSKWNDLTPFADIRDNSGVTNVGSMLDGWSAIRQKALLGVSVEAEVGGWNTVPSALLDILSRSRRAVARIVVPPGLTNWEGIRHPGGWTGTGFLVAPNLLLTNNHVLNDEAAAGAATAEFDFEWPVDSLSAGEHTSEAPAVRFELSPSRLFVTSPLLEGGLDYTFVWITEKAAEAFGTIRMGRGSFAISPPESVFVIHHPRGRPKEVSLDDTEVLGVNSVNILYAADTDKGSSGACVFNRNGKLVALHHANVEGEHLARLYPDASPRLLDGRPITVGNEGVKISAIALDLETRMQSGSKDAESAAEILACIEGSDTLTGIFGAIGRLSGAAQGAARVREIYGASEQDADVGFWNMHWLLPGAGGQVKAAEAVTAMIDLNQDVWCLTDVPPGAAAEIVRGMRDRFKEQVEIEFAEADAEVRQLATAVIWRPKWVSCRRESWAPDVLEALKRGVPDLPDQGPVFQSPPAVFRLSAAQEMTDAAARDWQVNVVPISLRTLRADELRRRLASKLLVRAIELTRDGSAEVDWLLGGEIDPPIAPEDAAALEQRGFESIAAADRRRGSAFNFLRAAKSGIRSVFATSDLEQSGSPSKVLEIIANRTVDKFIHKLADSRPAVLRLSRDSDDIATSETRLGEIVDAALPAAPSRAGDSFSIDLLPSGYVAAPPRAGDGSPAPRRAETAPVWSAGLLWQGLDKGQFLAGNRPAFQRLLAGIAAEQARDIPDLSPLTEIDLWVITFAEAGLGRSGVDPAFRHSRGEIGLFPLPNNIAFWIGPGAPAWDRPMPIETNIESYAKYLGQIRNKAVATVGTRTLYRDLFRAAGISGVAERQARLLAGIVHGYFVKANYRGNPVPFDRILSGFARDKPVDQILAGTGYVHDGTTILANRQRNIDAAIAAFRAS